MIAASPVEVRELKPHTVMVTGAAAGIGAATARLLASRGHPVLLVDLATQPLEAVAAEIIAQGGQALAAAVDICQRPKIDDALERAEDILGPLGAVAAVAGISRSRPATNLTELDWARVMDVNLSGSLNCALAAYASMKRAGTGSIVFVGSTAAFSGFPGRANYAASKHALLGLTRTLAIEWGADGIRVNMVAPGSIATERAVGAIPPAEASMIVDRTPAGRHGTPEEVAAVIGFLISKDASFLTGVMLPVDGGLSAGHLTSAEIMSSAR